MTTTTNEQQVDKCRAQLAKLAPISRAAFAADETSTEEIMAQVLDALLVAKKDFSPDPLAKPPAKYAKANGLDKKTAIGHGGSMGWYDNDKIKVTLADGTTVKCQAAISVVIVDSKWAAEDTDQPAADL